MRYLALWLCILMTGLLCLIPQRSHATGNYDLHNNPIPARYYGQWATPSCENPVNVLTIHGHLILDASSNTNFAYLITDSAMSNGVLFAHAGNINLFISDMRDKRMTVRLMLESRIKADIPIEKQIKSNAKYYYKCDKVEKDWLSLTPTAINTAPKFFELEKACDGADLKTCQNKAFSLLDTDHDGLLNMTELEHIYTLMIFYTSSINCDFPHNFNENVKSDKTTFAEDAIQAMDNNKDYKLSLDEIIDNWNIVKLQPSLESFVKHSDNLPILINIASGQ